MPFKTTATALAVALVAGAVSILPVADAAAATSPVRIVKVQYDSPGPDRGGNPSLNAEYVVIKNTSTRSQSLATWTLRDRQNHVYKFPAYSLGAGKSVTVHTGKGTATATNRYFKSGQYIWNNSGDSASLRNAGGSQLSVCSWTRLGAGSTNC